MKKWILVILLCLWSAQVEAATSVRFSWSAVSGATSYRVYYSTATITGTTGDYISTDQLGVVLTVDEVAYPTLFVAMTAVNDAGQSALSAVVETKQITTAALENATMDWLPIQAVEKSGNHIVTVTPSSGYGVTAMKIDGTWADGTTPIKAFNNVTANHILEVVVQRLPSMRF